MPIPGEAYITLAGALVGGSAIVVAALFRFIPSKRSGNGGITCKDHVNVVRDMVSQTTFDVAQQAINNNVERIDRNLEKIEREQRESFGRVHQRLDAIAGRVGVVDG